MERKCWLLTWNQARWAWDDKLDGYKEMIKEIEQVGKAFFKWTCGVNKSIKAGDRIFMIKLGSEPRGIIASGIAITDVFEGTHWDSEKNALGKKARRIYIQFDKILDYETDAILPYDELEHLAPDYHWSTQSSGIEIPKNVWDGIEEKWSV